MGEIVKDIIIDNNVLYLPQYAIQEVVEQELKFIIKFKKFDSNKYNKKDISIWKGQVDENEIKIFREWCVINDYLISDYC